jgi:hypothetical protein
MPEAHMNRDSQHLVPRGPAERLYRSGPWQPGTPSQGYQLPFTPAELFRTALKAINAELAQANTPFAQMSNDQQDAYLHSLEVGGRFVDQRVERKPLAIDDRR